jgi:YidC/Oxa1 family membrane protein insertase
MFDTLIVQPIFNLLVFIYALIPGHNFGLAIIIFTILVRLLMWPLVRKQLHHAKAMRQLQPEMKKIKAAAKGDRQKESKLVMELYKEREINPFASIGIVLLQLPILIGLYYAIRRLIDHPGNLVDFSYPFVQHLSWIQTIAQDIHKFDASLFGLVNLTKTASNNGHIYWPALVIVIASAAAQYLQSKQLLPQSDDKRSLRAIMREAGKGKHTDQTEVNAAVSRSTIYLIPVIVLVVSLNLAVALPLYWLVSSTVAYFQQARVLERDVAEAEAVAEKPSKKPPKAGLKVTRTTIDSPQTKKSSKKNKRRKR